MNMAQVCDKPLKINPFLTRRDPETGEWRVVQMNQVAPTKSCSTAQGSISQEKE